MRTALQSVLLAATLCGALDAQAAPLDEQRVKALASPARTVTSSTPLFGQVVLFSVPQGWKAAHQQERANSYILELIPEAQTLQGWSDMLTLQGYKGLAANANATPSNFLMLVGARIKEACPEHFVAQTLGNRTIDGHEAHVAVLGCARMSAPLAGAQTGQGEIALYVALKGSQDLYLIHRGLRGDGFERGKPPIHAANAEAVLRSLMPIKLCERSEPQAQCWSRKPR